MEELLIPFNPLEALDKVIQFPQRLSRTIHKTIESKSWKPIKIGQKGPSLSHLFFTDDLILFTRANP